MKFSHKTIETLGISAFTILFLLIPFFAWYNNLFEEAVSFSNTLAPLLSFFGSVLVFYALRTQIKANKMIQKQFKHGLLLSSIENLNTRIINSSVTIDNVNYTGYAIFDKILLDLKYEQLDVLKMHGLAILTSIPDKIALSYFERFIIAYSDKELVRNDVKHLAISLKEDLIREGEMSSSFLQKKFEINKTYKYFDDEEYSKRREFINAINNTYFYSMSGEFRVNIYEIAFRNVSEKYDIFLDSYFKSTFSILDTVYKTKKNKTENIEYLRNVFTNHEKILLFQKMMTGTTTKQFSMYLLELDIFRMTLYKKYFLMLISDNKIKKDIEYIKTLIYTN